MHGTLAFVLAAIGVVIGVHWISEQLRLPATALLTVAGIVYALLPGPNIVLHPDVVLTLVLPPLLYNAALQSSLLAIRTYVRPITNLSIGLVLFTALAVGWLLSIIVPGLGFAAGVALGAAVSPPDPVAALSIGRRAGLPPRLITVIEGEGLLNDATALTTYQVAVAAAVGGGFSILSAAGDFVFAAVGGLIVGVVAAWLLGLPRRLLGDPITAAAISLAAPFATYLLAEELHVSGVLAVVVAGLITGHRAPRVESGASRLQTASVWRLVDFLLEGVVFLLIGQQLPPVVRGLAAYSPGTVLAATAVTVGLVLVLRPLWLLATQLLPRQLHTRLGGDPARNERGLAGREILVLGWAGTRGVITLATAYALPLETDSHVPFADRNLLLFCAYLVVLVTLVGQGVTFALLARRLGVRASPADEARVRNEARIAAVDAALHRLDEMAEDGELPDEVSESTRDALSLRRHRYSRRLDSLTDTEEVAGGSAGYQAAVRAKLETIDAQHSELLRWRDAGKLSDAGLRLVQRELDLEELILPDHGQHNPT